MVSGGAGPAGKDNRRTRRSVADFVRIVLPGFIVTAVLLIVHSLHPAIMSEARNLIFDAYQRAAPRPYEDAPVRVVDIDDETLAKLGQWPWPRTDMARLVRTLAAAGASSIAMDIVFSEPDRTSSHLEFQKPGDLAAPADHDAVFGQALAETPSVTGYFLQHEPNSVRPQQKAGFAVSGASPLDAIPAMEGAIVPLSIIDDKAAGSGFVSLVGASNDGIVRTVPLVSRIGDTLLPSLSVEALRVAQGAGAIVVKSTTGSGEMGGGSVQGVVAVKVGAFEIPTTPAGGLWMYYTAPHPERIVPAWKIMTGALSAEQLKTLFAGRIVFIGTGAAGLRDLVSTPVSHNELGVVVHAQAVEQAILGRFLIRPDWSLGLERAILLVLGIGISLSLPGLGALRGGILSLAAFGASAGGSWFAFRYGALLLDPTYPGAAVISVYIAVTALSFYREERARAYIRQAFDRYLSPDLVERIARDPGRLELGGEERDMTVMFCDIRNFSHMSETLTAPQIIQFLIEFLTPMTDVLLTKKATIDKYIGDAILAFWNAPLDDPDHHRNAALGALAMMDKLKEMNEANTGAAGKVWPGEVKIGIGLNSGPCCVGNIGSKQRLNYSLIGDTVNVASRIEGMTKIYGVPIAMGHDLAAHLRDFALIELDLVRVVGRDMPERLFALVGPPALAGVAGFRELRAAQDAMLACYRAMDWDGAEAALEKLRPAATRFGYGRLADLYAARIAACRQSPPEAGWDGVYQATEK
jgi:adenylate cyclase